VIVSGPVASLAKRLALFALLAIIALLARQFLRDAWLGEFDDRIRQNAVRTATEWIRTKNVTCCEALDPPEGTPHGHTGQDYFEIRARDGAVLARSPLLADARLPAPDSGATEAMGWYHDKYLHRMRHFAMWTRTPTGDSILVHYALDHGEIKLRYRELDDILLVAGALLSALFAIAGFARRRRSLAPAPPPSTMVFLLTGSILLTSLVLGLATWTTYRIVERGWLEQMDQALENRALGLAALCERVDGNWQFVGRHLDSTTFKNPKSMQYYQAFDEQGRQLCKSASLGHLELPRQRLVPGERRYGWYHPGYLHRTRYVALSLGEPDGPTFYFGQDYRGMKAQLRGLRNILLVVWGCAEAVLVLLLSLLVRHALAPLRRIAGNLDTVDERNLSKFATSDTPREVRPLVDALDSALGRLRKAFERERTLVADLAHEIRTPLAATRTTLEVGLLDDEAHARQAMASSLEILGGMQSLADSLLSLARLEAGQIPSTMATFDAMPAITEAAAICEAACAERSLAFETDLPSTLEVVADQEWLRAILRNLLENATHHPRSASRVRLRAWREDGRAWIAVANDGSPLERSDLERMFDRFWRKDDSRSPVGSHAGLGLALSRELAQRMGGTLCADIPAHGWIEATLALPAKI